MEREIGVVGMVGIGEGSGVRGRPRGEVGVVGVSGLEVLDGSE